MLSMIFPVTTGILLPLLGTALGAGSVWFLPRGASRTTEKVLYGFAAGVMLASLVWSLLIPALDWGATPAPAILGFLGGILFFLASDLLFERLGEKKLFSGKQKMVFAVTLHNVPEGMAVGVAFARAVSEPNVAISSALLLSLGIALQNLPEGSIISTPLAALGRSRGYAFGKGVLSGIVEPIGAVMALLLTRLIDGILPFILSFAAGAMLYVVADELIPSLGGKSKEAGLFALGIGFALMMAMDVIFA